MALNTPEWLDDLIDNIESALNYPVRLTHIRNKFDVTIYEIVCMHTEIRIHKTIHSFKSYHKQLFLNNFTLSHEVDSAFTRKHLKINNRYIGYKILYWFNLLTPSAITQLYNKCGKKAIQLKKSFYDSNEFDIWCVNGYRDDSLYKKYVTKKGHVLVLDHNINNNILILLFYEKNI